MRVFWIYFWKSYYRKTKKHQWCVQWKGRKIIVSGFQVTVPIFSKHRKRNPHAVVWGRAQSVKVVDKIAVIS